MLFSTLCVYYCTKYVFVVLCVYLYIYFDLHCRKSDNEEDDKTSRRWGKRAFQRRSSEIEVRLHRTSGLGNTSSNQTTIDCAKSPTTSRRRSSSIAVARPTPDLHRFIIIFFSFNFIFIHTFFFFLIQFYLHFSSFFFNHFVNLLFM